MAATNIDYVKTYFEFPTLTKVHGEPTYEALQEIKDEIKANAAAVESELGGGNNGHLGLVLSPTEYTRVHATAYVRPIQPPVLEIAPDATGPVATRARSEYDESKRLWREVVDVERALIKQIVQAVEPKYLKAMRNSTTNSITKTIPQIFQYLFKKFGNIDSEQLMTEERAVRDMVYNLQDPLVTMYDAIDELERLGVAAENPYTTRQLISFGLEVLRNTREFEDGIRAWNRRPVEEKTWEAFKEHFETEHRELKSVRGKTMQSTAFHQANFIATRVLEEVQSVQNLVTEAMERLPPAQDKENVPPPQPVANAAVSTDAVQLQMLELIKNLQDEVKSMKKSNRNSNNNYSASGQQRKRTNVSKYCWSHGACTHSSKECNRKKTGHQDDATFKNKMGGSTYYCPNE
jgi:translation initiation factor 2B subunit (eIF-2B alpha/beta/delta family)